jgi:hypothetical protein
MRRTIVLIVCSVMLISTTALASAAQNDTANGAKAAVIAISRLMAQGNQRAVCQRSAAVTYSFNKSDKPVTSITVTPRSQLTSCSIILEPRSVIIAGGKLSLADAGKLSISHQRMDGSTYTDVTAGAGNIHQTATFQMIYARGRWLLYSISIQDNGNSIGAVPG